MRVRKMLFVLPAVAGLLCSCSAYEGETHAAYATVCLESTVYSVQELYDSSDFVALLRVTDADSVYDSSWGAVTDFTADILTLYKGEQGDRTLRTDGGELGLGEYLDSLGEGGIRLRTEYTRRQLDKDTVHFSVGTCHVPVPGETLLFFANYTEDGTYIRPFYLEMSIFTLEGDILSLFSGSEDAPVAQYLIESCNGTVEEDTDAYIRGCTVTCPFSAVEPLLTVS